MADRTFRGFISGIQFSPTEVSHAQHRGTTVENLRNVANSKINDAITAVKDLAAVCEEENRDRLNDVIQALG